MKKIISLLLILFVITGCEATYTIDIDDSFNENLMVVPNGISELAEIRENAAQHPAYYDEDYTEDIYATNDDDIEDEFADDDTDDVDTYYSDDEDEEDTDENLVKYNMTFTDRLYYNFKFGENYQDSNIAYSSVEEFDVSHSSREDDYSVIYANDFTDVFYEYPGLTKLTINIKTNKEVIEHNADKVNGNIYTWIIKKENPEREISISYLDDRYYTELDTTGEGDYKGYSFADIDLNPSPNIDPADNPNYDPYLDPKSPSYDPTKSSDYNAYSDPDSKQYDPDSPNYDPTKDSTNPSYDPTKDPKNPSYDLTNNSDNTSNNEKETNSKNKNNNGLSEKQSNNVLHVLYILFFGLIFVIIIFSKKFKK